MMHDVYERERWNGEVLNVGCLILTLFRIALKIYVSLEPTQIGKPKTSSSIHMHN